jgi:hypothetical protein
MPYELNKVKTGFKVCKKNNPKKCFSKKGLSKTKAEKQMKAIIISENKKGGAKPKNLELYNKIKDEIYKKQPKHSLYRSARIVKEYKKQGGEFEEDKLPDMNIKKWFKQKWVSIPDYLNGDIVQCGNSELKGVYPLCRPLEIAKKLKPEEIKDMIKLKQELKQKPLKTKSIIGTDKLNIKPTKSGLGLLSKMNENDYLEIVKYIATLYNYDPDKLTLANDKKHKLDYEGVKFGGYKNKDFIQYMYEFFNNKITEDNMLNHRKKYLARATKIKGNNWRDNPISPNNLAIKILWVG